MKGGDRILGNSAYFPAWFNMVTDHFQGCGNDSNHTSKDEGGWGYAVFGKLVKGHGIVNKIKGVATGRSGMHGDVFKELIELRL